MTGEVLPFGGHGSPIRHEALLAAVTELHAFLAIDHAEGSSPVRVYFVLNPAGRAKIADVLDAPENAAARKADMLALVAYDFPIALFRFVEAAPEISSERAKEIISAHAELQTEVLLGAARALGVDSRMFADFDAEALKVVFFPNTQETVTHVCGLSLCRS